MVNPTLESFSTIPTWINFWDASISFGFVDIIIIEYQYINFYASERHT